jgi:DNA-binding MarR family transcriptional regulator
VTTTRDSLSDLSKPVTGGAVLALAQVLDAAAKTNKVARVIDDLNLTVYGIARNVVGDVDGGPIRSLAGLDDARTLYLRVTTREGQEVFWPIAELAAEIELGRFSPDYDWS